MNAIQQMPRARRRAADAYLRAENPAAILSLLDELQTLREERTAWRVTAENAEAAVKQARIDALEDAKQACINEADQFDSDYVAAIESLKGQP